MRALRASLAEVEQKQERQLLALEREDDPAGILYRCIRERVLDLETRRQDLGTRLEKLEPRQAEEAADFDLLDDLPVTEENLSELPAELLRSLFDACA